jgi:hypothetical protein
MELNKMSIKIILIILFSLIYFSIAIISSNYLGNNSVEKNIEKCNFYKECGNDLYEHQYYKRDCGNLNNKVIYFLGFVVMMIIFIGVYILTLSFSYVIFDITKNSGKV